MKSLAIQSLNIDCPRCGALAAMECRTTRYEMMRPHKDRVRAMERLIEDSKHDWVVRKIERERNATKQR